MSEEKEIERLRRQLAEERAKADELRRLVDRLFPARRRGYADPDELMTKRRGRG